MVQEQQTPSLQQIRKPQSHRNWIYCTFSAHNSKPTPPSIPNIHLQAAFTMAYVKSDLDSTLPLVASGKVRDIYELDAKSLLFVATDRISAYDVIMANVSFINCPVYVDLANIVL